MEQQALLHETFEGSLRAVLQGIYGKAWAQKAASEMWPTEDPTTKANYLDHALTINRDEKLGTAEIFWILRKGREHGFHAAMYFLTDELSYIRPTTTDPVDEAAELMREYIRNAKSMRINAERIERLMTNNKTMPSIDS